MEAERSSFLDLNSNHLTTFQVLADTKEESSTVTNQGIGLKKVSQPANVDKPDDNDFSIDFNWHL